ncbi:MAG TPA: hypothetical protein PK822_08755 [Bacillota bacterium]|nr:hypothetical protein [Bacillota bacterium]
MQAGTLKDGFGIQITFGTGLSGRDYSGIMLLLDPTSVTPPGLEGGDAIDTTTHSNTAYRTKHKRSLKEITDASMTVVYDPGAWTSIVAAINDNTLITFTFPDASSLAVYGYLKSFIPNEYVEGEQATAECVIVVTNWNHNTGAEAGPIYTAGS